MLLETEVSTYGSCGNTFQGQNSDLQKLQISASDVKLNLQCENNINQNKTSPIGTNMTKKLTKVYLYMKQVSILYINLCSFENKVILEITYI